MEFELPPRWAFERQERERARYLGMSENLANVDVRMREPQSWRSDVAFAAHIAEHHVPIGDRVRAELAKPVAVEGEPYLKGTGELFDPWEIFPSLYGSYSSEFDDMAILVLDNVLNGRFGAKDGEGLAHEMFREMLCTAGLCNYGTSPRGCFPHHAVDGIVELLTALLAKWREYRAAEWGDD
jgi:hypothetical protein